MGLDRELDSGGECGGDEVAIAQSTQFGLRRPDCDAGGELLGLDLLRWVDSLCASGVRDCWRRDCGEWVSRCDRSAFDSAGAIAQPGRSGEGLDCSC